MCEAILIIGAAVLAAVGVCNFPGGPLNKHDWISDHYKRQPCPSISSTKKPADNVVTFSLEGMQYENCGPSPMLMPQHIEFHDTQKVRQFPDGCWDIDFCTRHFEVRVRECGKEWY